MQVSVSDTWYVEVRELKLYFYPSAGEIKICKNMYYYYYYY